MMNHVDVRQNAQYFIYAKDTFSPVPGDFPFVPTGLINRSGECWANAAIIGLMPLVFLQKTIKNEVKKLGDDNNNDDDDGKGGDGKGGGGGGGGGGDFRIEPWKQGSGGNSQWWTVKDTVAHKETLFVFSDNWLNRGTQNPGAAQAVIRGQSNAFGFSTGTAGNTPGRYRDKDWNKKQSSGHTIKEMIDIDIARLRKVMQTKQYTGLYTGAPTIKIKRIVFSQDGYGTGVFKLQTLEPGTYNYIYREMAKLKIFPTWEGQWSPIASRPGNQMWVGGDWTKIMGIKPTGKINNGAVMIFVTNVADDKLQKGITSAQSAFMQREIPKNEISFPGGGINQSESPMAGIKREFEEETGYKLLPFIKNASKQYQFLSHHGGVNEKTAILVLLVNRKHLNHIFPSGTTEVDPGPNAEKPLEADKLYLIPMNDVDALSKGKSGWIPPSVRGGKAAPAPMQMRGSSMGSTQSILPYLLKTVQIGGGQKGGAVDVKKKPNAKKDEDEKQIGPKVTFIELTVELKIYKKDCSKRTRFAQDCALYRSSLISELKHLITNLPLPPPPQDTCPVSKTSAEGAAKYIFNKTVTPVDKTGKLAAQLLSDFKTGGPITILTESKTMTPPVAVAAGGNRQKKQRTRRRAKYKKHPKNKLKSYTRKKKRR